MQCPSCNVRTKVVESRSADGGMAVRRRRACPECGDRFTTFERIAHPVLYVTKRDGTRQRFDREKLAAGLFRAAHKRPVDGSKIDELVDRIEAAGVAAGELEASRIGEMALEGLRELDRVAYLQFAAVYKEFRDADEFTTEVARLRSEKGPDLPYEGAGSVRAERNPARLPAKAPRGGEKR